MCHFPSQGPVNHVWFTKRTGTVIGGVSLSPKDKPKHVWWWRKICFCWRRCFSLIAFVSPVHKSRVIVWVWGFIWWWFGAGFSVPQQRRSFCLLSCLQSPVVQKYQRDKCYLSAREEQLLFHELGVTLRDLFVWPSGPLRPKVFPPVGFQHTWCFGTHEILKKLFVISR